MLTDALLQLSAAQAVTTTAVSTNTIDLGVNRDMGQGSDLYAVFTVDETVTAAGAATVTFQIISSAASNLSSPTVLIESAPIGKAELTAGRDPIAICLPESFLNAQPIGQRYLGVQYTIATGPLTAGKFTCSITDSEVSSNKNYPSGFTVF
ncbi:Bbp16 family capsid cement protein [Methylomonas koyamae]|uniref:Bbp16 family capsid cement protein n=1 Tax=Methylomonas koyamae TaxID=702114 RepID=UPI001128264B|nr:hypothetical protein [Methylomonas koyamae]TPQ24932.1 hypothetical protein C2U68_17290 [Methylomonas koyamae]